MRKNLKKVLATSMCAVMLLSVWGCSKDDSKKEETKETTKKEKVEEVKPLSYKLDINDDITSLDETAEISELLYGLFLEDINYAVDGGLYGEMIKNRSFEYGKLAIGDSKHGWTNTKNAELTVNDGSTDLTSINTKNPKYAIINNTADTLEGIANNGFLSGLSIEAGKTYKVSAYIKGMDGFNGNVEFSFSSSDEQTTYGKSSVEKVNANWWKYETEITVDTTVNKNAKFFVKIPKGKIAVDMISVFPKETYNNRENGLRKDLVEYLKSLNPKFLRFPGGCVIEGKSLETAYNWKDSIGNGEKVTINGKETVGDVSVRPIGVDIWADLNKASAHPYYASYGLGFYEYFLLCEDLGALAVPVLNAGMSCPIQSPKYEELDVNSEEFKTYIQDALDLVEFCRGDASTKWGAVRIAMGHSEPFELKYIGIGNEQWQESYFVHYKKFVEAFKEAEAQRPELYKDIELIVANGPASSDTFGWDKVEKNGGLDYAGLVDEHYYQTPSWFLSNTDRYDSYKRGTTKVFLGEYAAKSNTLTAALAEAAYLTGVERNADVVEMACYAPLFANETANQWTPDMIWFSNNDVYGSVNYYIQKMYANNVGTKILNTEFKKTEGTGEKKVLSGKIGLGTWETAAEFDDLKVVSNKTKKILYTQNFKNETSIKDAEVVEGNFKVTNGVLKQLNSGAAKNTNTGDVAYFGDEDWSDYTMTVKATATSGKEGFIIPIAVKDKDNCFFWNFGGWGNTVSCLQQVENGAKSDQITGTVKDMSVQYGKEYDLKIVVSGNNIKCYSFGALVIDYTYKTGDSIYQTVSFDEVSNDVIVKLVNVKAEDIDVTLTLPTADLYNKEAKLIQLKGKSGSDTNSLNNQENVITTESTINISKEFTYKVPKLSATIIRIHKN